MSLRFTEEELRDLALQIGNEWQELGTRLGFQNARIQHLRMNNQGDVGNAIFEMLVEWQEQLPSSCTDGLATLATPLERTRRADLAYKISSRNGFRGTTDPVHIFTRTGRIRSTPKQFKIDEPDIDLPDHMPGNHTGYQPHSRRGGSLIHTEGRNNATVVIGDNSNVTIGGLPSSGSSVSGAHSSGAAESSTTPLIYTKGEDNLSLYVGNNTRANIGLTANTRSSTGPSAQTQQTSANQQKRPFQQVGGGGATGRHTVKKQKSSDKPSPSSVEGSEIGSLKSFSGIIPSGDANDRNSGDHGNSIVPGVAGDYVDASAFDQLKASDMKMGDIIGSGAYGDVHHVTFKKGSFREHREAAAKKLNKVQPQEVDILRRVNHPNIVKLLAYVEEDFINLIVMELADQSLRKYLDDHKGNVCWQLLENWVREVCSAIEYLHEGVVMADGKRKSVVHRDIKASNCLLFGKDSSPSLKVADFSISRETDRTKATKTGKGSFPWTAPEVLDKVCFSTTSDIYGLAVLFWEMYTQKIPESTADKTRGICGQPLDGELQVLFPDYMLRILPLCWCMDYKKRPTIQRVKDMLPHDSAGVGSSTQRGRSGSSIPMDTN